MARRRPDRKIEALKKHGALNPSPDRVKDALFQGSDFFDPRDRVQVKYEMLRRARIDGEPVNDVAGTFGVSRPTFYQTQSAFQREGLPGLLPKKRGPRGGHKLTREVITYLESCLTEDQSLNVSELTRRVEEHYSIRVHPRSIERALARQKKKRR
jgi:transposase